MENGRGVPERENPWSEGRFRALADRSPDAIVLMAADETTLYASPAVERISGRAPSQWQGKEAFESVHPADRERVSSAFARIRATRSEPVTFECRLQHRDGSYRWIEATGTNLLADPSVAAIVAFLHDATTSRERRDSPRNASDARRSEERLRVL